MANKSNGWTRVALGDVVKLNKERAQDPLAEGFSRYVGLEHLEPGDLKIRRWGHVADGTTFTNVFRPGQVLFAKRRAYQRKVAVAEFSGVCSGDIYVLTPKDDRLLQEILPFICQTDRFFDHALGTSAGSLSPRTNWKSLAGYEFALPPHDEQRRIAITLMAVDLALDRLRSVGTSAARLLRSVVDNVAVLAKEAGSLIPLQDLVEDDRPITYGILKPGSDFDGGVPVIKVRDYPDGYILQEGLLRTDPKIDKEYSRSRLRKDDLLISIRGTVGRLAFVPASLDGANITQDTARISIGYEHNRQYVHAMLRSTLVQTQIAASITGLAVQGINIGELRRIRIPIVERERQQELVSEVIAIRDSIRAEQDRRDALRLVRSTMLRWIQEGNG
jgi:type I restriction enzyme S subunit